MDGLFGIREIRGSAPDCVSWKVKHGDDFENTESTEATELRATSESLQVDLPSLHPRNPWYLWSPLCGHLWVVALPTVGQQKNPLSVADSGFLRVETRGVEPLTPALQRQCSPN